MTGTINPALPEKGEGRETSDGRIKGSLITLRDGLNSILNEENKVPTSALSQSKFTWYTPKVIATEESRTNTAFGTLTTADEITGVVVAANSVLCVSFGAIVKSSVAAAGSVGIYIGSNAALGTPVLTGNNMEVATSGTAFGRVATNPALSPGLEFNTNATSAVTTGRMLNAVEIGELAAGTYAVAIKYKATSGSITAKERTLRVAVLG